MSQHSLMHEVLAFDTQWHSGAVSSWKHLWVHRLAKEACGPRLRTSFLSPSNQPARMSARHLWPRWRRRQAKSSSCTQTQHFSHQCVSGRQRREAHSARWLVRKRSLPRQKASTECNDFGWSTAEWVRTPAVGSTLHISLQQQFFPSSFVIN